MKTVARLSAEDRSDFFRNTANRMQMSDAMRLIWAQQSEAQFFFKTALQEFEVLLTHGYSVAIHN